MTHPQPNAESASRPSCAPSLIAILACFNRREQTLGSLAALSRSCQAAGMAPRAVLVDDGSTDGTGRAVTEAFPWTRVIRGTGSLFWCRGMNLAFKEALREDPDFILWLNDDTTLRGEAVEMLVGTARERQRSTDRPVIVVGSTTDECGQLTYGGERSVSKWLPTKLVKVPPGEVPTPIDTMNGNCVLVDRGAARALGPLDPAFEHAMGDTDYGFRAVRRGIGLWLSPGILASCSGNSRVGTYLDRSLPLSRRWTLMMSPKGLPWRSWLRLTFRHGGVLWPLVFAWPYARLLLGSVPSPRHLR